MTTIPFAFETTFAPRSRGGSARPAASVERVSPEAGEDLTRASIRRELGLPPAHVDALWRLTNKPWSRMRVAASPLARDAWHEAIENALTAAAMIAMHAVTVACLLV